MIPGLLGSMSIKRDNFELILLDTFIASLILVESLSSYQQIKGNPIPFRSINVNNTTFCS